MLKKSHFLKYISLFLLFILFSFINGKTFCQLPYYPQEEREQESKAIELHKSFEIGYVYSPSTVHKTDYGWTKTDYKSNKGFNIGLGLDLVNISDFLIFHLRSDLSYILWEHGDSKEGYFISYFGLRVFFPVFRTLMIYGDIGVNMNISDLVGDYDSKSQVGFAYGGGIEYLIPFGASKNQFAIGFTFRYYNNKNNIDFITVTPYLGLKY